MGKYFTIEQIGREAHLYIFGDIVPDQWFESEISPLSFQQELAKVDADVIHVHIDSYGGAVSAGWAIYNTLREHSAKIVTHADGFVASAALYPFMAGDERIMSNVSALFFHQVLMSAYGNADDLRAAADSAEKLNELGISAFTNAGVDKDLVLQLEKAETWVSPTEALEYGLATSIKTVQQPNQAQSIKHDLVKKLFAEQKMKQEQKPTSTIMQMLDGLFNN